MSDFQVGDMVRVVEGRETGRRPNAYGCVGVVLRFLQGNIWEVDFNFQQNWERHRAFCELYSSCKKPKKYKLNAYSIHKEYLEKAEG